MFGRWTVKHLAVAAVSVLALVAVGTLASQESVHSAAARWVAPAGSPAPPTAASPSPSLSPSAPPSPTAVPYSASVQPLPAAVAAAMNGASWHPGCPTALSSLRLVHLAFVGFDGAAHQGELVVNAAVTEKIVRIFGRLYAARFPIRKMVPIDAYGGSDDRSMADDNTSMFNCRNAYGSKNWSVHAFGRAVDINTVENPYFPNAHTIVPPAGKAFADRADVRPGMIVAGDLVVRAFQAEGFTWGGAWKDYQHFEI